MAQWWSKQKSKIARWWNKQEAATQVAVVTGLFTLGSAVCGGILWVTVNIPALLEAKDAVESKRQQPAIGNPRVSEPGIITANYNGKSYYIVSPNCWKIIDASDDTKIEGEDYPAARLDFVVLVGGEKILINDISIILDKYLPAPETQQLTDYTIKLGQFFDPGIHYTDLGKVDLFPGNVEFHPLNIRSIGVSANEPEGFVILASFHQPGEYIFHIEVLVSDLKQEEKKLASEPLTLNWVNHPDLSNVTFFDPINSREIKLVVCE